MMIKLTFEFFLLVSRSGRQGASQMLGPEALRRLKKVARVLSLACSLEQRAALERARDAARSRHIGGLVEQVQLFFSPLASIKNVDLGFKAAKHW